MEWNGIRVEEEGRVEWVEWRMAEGTVIAGSRGRYVAGQRFQGDASLS